MARARNGWILPALRLGAAASALAAPGCGPSEASGPVSAQEGAIARAEHAARESYARTPIEIRGRVLDRLGAPILSAELELGPQGTTTGDDGSFALAGLPRRNAVLVVRAPGFRVERVPLELGLPLDRDAVQLPPLLLFPDDLARLTFGGDVQLGRRYLDPTGTTPPDEVPADDPRALIRASDPGPGTAAVLAPIRPWLSDGDFTSVNLETVVTGRPDTPDLDNAYLFFTLPGSLPPLRDAGVDYVANGNNHIYDYLDDGLGDTLAALDEAGLLHSGAGQNVDEAFEAARTELHGSGYSLLSLVSTEGLAVPNATAATETRAGAADLNDDARIASALERERDAGYFPIAELHTGYEYSEAPADDATTSRMELVADQGAALVVCHHPHVAQGFSFRDGTLIAHSLGNLVFDQQRPDAELGLLLSVDLDGERLANAEARGVLIDAFVPRPLVGHANDLFLRRIGGSSAPWGTLVVPYGASAWVVPPERADELETVDRHVPATFHMGSEEFAVVDLRSALEPGESIASVRIEQKPRSVRVGRDLLVFGDMEDADTDDTELEAQGWDTSGLEHGGESYVCRNGAYRGTAALCSMRADSSAAEASFSLREPLHVPAGVADAGAPSLTFLSTVSGENAGRARVEVRYYDDSGSEQHGERTVELEPGSYPWNVEVHDLDVQGSALRLFFHHAPPPHGEGLFRVDDVAVIAWQDLLDPSGATELDVPHARDFLRVEGPPGVYVLDVTLRKRAPKAALAP